MIEVYPFLTLVPPIVAIVLVIWTKKVIVSLFAGIVSAAFLTADGSPVQTVVLIWKTFSGLFWDSEQGSVNSYYILIVLFLLVLGIITSLVLMAGGTSAFSVWTAQRINTGRGAQSLAAGLGTAIFVDDYFNALAVGQVARPVADQHRVSRAKLAYLIDSSSAPVAVLAPFSSWGASIIGIMAPIIVTVGVDVSDAGAFIRSAGLNYYAIAAVVLLWFTVAFDLNIGPMRHEERRARLTGEVYDPDVQVPGQLSDNLPKHEPGARRALIVPFVILVVGVIGGIGYTGYAASGSVSILEVLANTDVALSLNIGGACGLIAAVYYYVRYTHDDRVFTRRIFRHGVIEGAKSMLPAIEILLSAWVLGGLISELGTGQYVGSLVTSAALPAQWLVPIMFVAAGAMAFATGTSWGSFGILLPIAGDVLAAVPGGAEVLIPAFGAVLAGAVWGDHCSPISDTTILSSTGAGCNHITHVTTQLPYALIGATSAFSGYVTFALTGSGLAGLGATLVILMIIATLLQRIYPLDMENA
ncbi:Na+/H+ antiporter NhaC family protein [Arcanobacterium pinnipediorum]|uniref:Na+/H+ antiporter NhaC family protein n=1 Tax=Arcanobacterium pinnipediorum TaxID=1503041 RepID=A0ABY5AF05_9ACTO|nr:Na+/H+ antiporter NhaC family protein [Arcanobacterium pinnipediorum]USR78784.1 Na+/H+ antiporter NhaC family protein [Arcanobacterium pinnipediorum]